MENIITLYPQGEEIHCKVGDYEQEIKDSVSLIVTDGLFDDIMYQNLAVAKEIMQILYKCTKPTELDEIKAKFTLIGCSDKVRNKINKHIGEK